MSTILWFGDIGRNNSFSRVNENVLQLLQNKHNIKLHILSPPKQNTNNNFKPGSKTTMHYVGEEITVDGVKIDWNKFRMMMNMCPDTIEWKMKYALLQAVSICDVFGVDYMVIVGGVNMCEYFCKLLFTGYKLNTKIIIWTPFDYIPSPDSIKFITQADTLWTTTPLMVNKLVDMGIKNVKFVGHAVENLFFHMSRRDALKWYRKNNHKFYYCGVSGLSGSDVVVLNANNSVERKRLDVTYKGWKIYNRNNPSNKVILWIHTDTTNDEFERIFGRDVRSKVEGLIVTHNQMRTYELNYIYNICQLGLQTSSGEGYSLTNLEHTRTGAIQIVPRFLATEYHFVDCEGSSSVMLDVLEVNCKDENGNEIRKGYVSSNEVARGIEKGVGMYRKGNKRMYSKSLDIGWENVVGSIVESFVR